MKFTVATKDVDGGNKRTYKTLDAAVKRFESMSGRTVQSALDERFYDPETFAGTMPAATFLAMRPFSLGVVSDYGCVVVLSCQPE